MRKIVGMFALTGVLLMASAVSSTLCCKTAWAESKPSSESPASNTSAVELQRLAKKFAEQGDAVAQFDLGVMYYNGNGVPKDYTKASKYYTLAAEQGLSSAQYNLGLLHEHGKGIPKDYAKAALWYSFAAEQGEVKSQAKLGYLCFFGLGVPKDFVTAYMWLNLAASSGLETVVAARGELEQQLIPEQIAEGQRLSREWLAKRETQK